MDRSTSPERGQSSHTGRETRQTHETSQERIARVRRENTQNYGVHLENRRANETPEQRDKRLDTEREGLCEKLKSARNNSEEQDIAHQWQKDYIQREKIVRGLENRDYLNYNQHQIEEYAKICIEAESLVATEETVRGLDDLVHKITEDINFRRTLKELNIPSINRSSDEWQEFRVNKYDDIASRYKLDQKEDRMLMLADIMQYERSNRSNIDQLGSKEYKTIVKLTMNEWEAWKRENNISQS
jgi:hypothetical protein